MTTITTELDRYYIIDCGRPYPRMVRPVKHYNRPRQGKLPRRTGSFRTAGISPKREKFTAAKKLSSTYWWEH